VKGLLNLTLAGLLLAPAALAGPGAHGPGGEHLDAPTAPAPADGLARRPDGSVQVPKSVQRRWNLRTVMPSEAEQPLTQQLPGWVMADPAHSGRVQALHGGRIEAEAQGLPQPGQTVRAGQLLAWVRHHAQPFERGNQEAQWRELQAQAQLAAQRVARLESLEGSVPRKEIEAARVEAQALQQRAQAVGNSLNAREALRAPVAGVIARSAVQTGQVVTSDELLFEIVDPNRALVEALSPDAGLAARVSAASLLGLAQARLQFIGAARLLREGQLPLHFRVQGGELAIGQPVTLLVQLKESVKGQTLPAQAVVRNAANETVVWIKAGAERFIPQPVQVQALDAQTVVVTQGLGADNRVVVQGATLLAQVR
jgi:biotin carboxyl carrier protein